MRIQSYHSKSNKLQQTNLDQIQLDRSFLSVYRSHVHLGRVYERAFKSLAYKSSKRFIDIEVLMTITVNNVFCLTIAHKVVGKKVFGSSGRMNLLKKEQIIYFNFMFLFEIRLLRFVRHLSDVKTDALITPLIMPTFCGLSCWVVSSSTPVVTMLERTVRIRQTNQCH